MSNGTAAPHTWHVRGAIASSPAASSTASGSPRQAGQATASAFSSACRRPRTVTYALVAARRRSTPQMGQNAFSGRGCAGSM